MTVVFYLLNAAFLMHFTHIIFCTLPNKFSAFPQHTSICSPIQMCGMKFLKRRFSNNSLSLSGSQK